MAGNMRSAIGLGATIAWTALHNYQIGYHISALNGIQEVLTCNLVPSTPLPPGGGTMMPYIPSWATNYFGPLTPCVPMTPAKFGMIATMFTLGALIGSLAASPITRLLGRVGTLRLGSLCCLLGSLMFAIANSPNIMLISRFIVGFGCSAIGTNTALLMADLAPSLKVSLGVLNQISIVSGLITAQSLAIPLAEPFAWRQVLLIATGLAAALLFSSVFVSSDACPRSKLDDEESPLLAKGTCAPSLTLRELLASKDPAIRSGFYVVLTVLITQQLSGIGPLCFYSTAILRPVFPANAGVVAIAILLMKLPAAMMAMPLLPRLGANRLLIATNLIMAFAWLILSFALNWDWPILSVVSVLLYIAAFGTGPGPVSWMIVAECLPPEARTAVSAIGGVCNAITGLIVALTFLPLQQLLMVGATGGEGNVFLIFVVLCAGSAFAVNLYFKRYQAALNL